MHEHKAHDWMANCLDQFERLQKGRVPRLGLDVLKQV